MSWSATSYPPPPRRSSRSRSPRGGPPPARPPYPDTAYGPQDPYRAEWDAYERDRAWANYERERAAYEYSRRGRSRSPPPDEAGRKRRRSFSPYDRDRYESRPRYGDEYESYPRGYGYTSPRRGQYSTTGGYSSSRRPPPDPHTFDHPATLKQYADWFRYYYPQQAMEEDIADKAAEHEAGDGTKPRDGIRSKWEKYKKDFAATQLQTMFEHHRKSPWFAEKYDPSEEMRNLRMRVRKDGWKGHSSKFLLDLETGKFDPDITETDSTADVKSPKEAATNGSSDDKSVVAVADVKIKAEANGEGTVAAVGEESKSLASGRDDEMQITADAEEDGGDHEANAAEMNGKSATDAKRGMVPMSSSRGEEISVPTEGNQVMIRTIPPDIGRVKLEEACRLIPGFMYLALGEPVQKRNYYRAGWIRFRDDADMATVMSELSERKIEGFKLHVTHQVRPFVNRIRYAPEVASRPDRLERDLANAKKLCLILEEEAAMLRNFKVETANISRVDMTDRPADAAGNDREDTMATDDDDDADPAERGSDAVERRIEKIMQQWCGLGLVSTDNERAYEAKKTIISLDLYLAYLRGAFHACYYCCVVTDHLEELQRKCLKHVRKPPLNVHSEESKGADTEKTERDKYSQNEDPQREGKEREVFVPKEKSDRERKRNDEKWPEWLDSKIALLINRDGLDPRDYGGKNYDEELTKLTEPFIKQEDEGKFRCKTCLKLFKATSFVGKHIANKHPDLVKQLEDIPYFNNFALDPHHIQPFSYPPPPTGNSQMPPPQAYGLQGPAYREPLGDYGRSNAYYGSSNPPYSGSYPGNGALWDPYASYPYPPPAYPILLPPRRDEATTARRLSDRIGGYAAGLEQPSESAVIPAAAGLPAKPPATVESAHPRRGGRGGGGSTTGVVPPPPLHVKEDPRAAAGRKVSYHDMDLVAEGDVELTY